MISNDNNIIFDRIGSVYYKGEFTEVPNNSFSICLIGYLGNINLKLYNDYLKKINDFVNDDIDVNFLKTDLWKDVKSLSEPANTLIKFLTEDNSFNINVYQFLSIFFKINIYIHNNIDNLDVIDKNIPIYNFVNIDSSRKIYLYLHKEKLYPIFRQSLDGAIVLFSNTL